MRKIIIVGGGAAGMAAAIAAASDHTDVELFEKNEKLGKKIFITGKGRCNLTNACEEQDFFENVCTNPRFLYSSFYGLTNHDVIQFFEDQGMRTKTERGNRVFPVSDHSSDVIRALSFAMQERGVKVRLNTAVKDIVLKDGAAVGVRLTDGSVCKADAVIVCTGGLSYYTTGSTGDGYKFAKAAGLKVTDCSPSLVPMNVQEEDAKEMQGLSLRNVSIRIKDGKKNLYEDFGEMMFTHFGVTGPLILTASTKVQKALAKHPIKMEINLKPALTREQLDARFLREFDANRNKALKNILGAIYPSKLIPVMMKRSGIPEDRVVHDISREERDRLVDLTRALPFTLTSLRGWNEAIITRGGVSVKEIDPGTMEAKNVPGLYFAGEVLDLDAVTGGFNLQIAWSTGHAAGVAAKGEEE